MCCIFTCCGWMIDLIQRLWTFAMSCCISSAICCSLITASMSGIALGYNYSLAEYIDLKETNVSIYLKRGVFDDEVADDMEWRRSGRMPVDGLIGENNLVTGGSDDDSKPVQSGRRLDDSIFESNDKNSFEGALMKLTAKPPADSSTISIFTREYDVSKIMSELPKQPLNQLKAIQSAINMQKEAEARRRQYETDKITPEPPPPAGRRMLPHFSFGMQPSDVFTTGNSLRDAVPPRFINSPVNWLPVKAPQFALKEPFDEFFELPTVPPPATRRPTPIRPSRPRPRTEEPRPTLTARIITFQDFRGEREKNKEIKEKLASDENLMLDKEDPSDMEREKLRKDKNQSEEDYEEDIKGIPIRRKRNIKKDESGSKSKTNLDVEDIAIKSILSNSNNQETTADKINHFVKITTEACKGLQKSENLLTTTFLKLLISTTIS